MPNNSTTSDTRQEEIIKRGRERFEAIREKVRLEPRYNGYYIVIEVDSGQYFLGESKEDAMAQAVENCGQQEFYVHLCEFF